MLRWSFWPILFWWFCINDITKSKWGSDGLDVNGFNKEGIHIFTKTKFNPQGYDQDGHDKTGKLILKKNMYRFVDFIKDWN